jgi:small subunit ribosomal protein S17
MPRKKKEDEIEPTADQTAETSATDDTTVEALAAGDDAVAAEESSTAPEQILAAESAAEPDADSSSILDTVAGVAAGALETVAVAVGKGAAKLSNVVSGDPVADSTVKVHKRAEKIGIVASDKMTKTVTVRVDRLVKHPVYRKYIKKRKKFMAHDETGAKIGDKVRIVETRPLSARKRWRVVEIIQKAEL